jgi:hypothetical protein
MLLYSISSQLIMSMTLLLLTLLSKWLRIDYRHMCVRHTNHTFTHYRMGHLPELAKIGIASSRPLASTYHMVLVCVCYIITDVTALTCSHWLRIDVIRSKSRSFLSYPVYRTLLQKLF